MRSHVSCMWCNQVFMEMDCIVLASSTAQARGIKFYEVLIA